MNFGLSGNGTISYGGQNFDDGTSRDFAEGSTITITIKPDASATATVYIDGVIVEPYTADSDSGDPNLTFDDYNNTYYYTFINIHANHVLQVAFNDVNCSLPIYAPFGTSDFSQPVTLTSCWTTSGWSVYGTTALTRESHPIITPYIQLPSGSPCKAYFTTAGSNVGQQYSYEVNIIAGNSTISLGTRTVTNVAGGSATTGMDSIDLAQFAGQIVKISIVPVAINSEFIFIFYGVTYAHEENTVEVAIAGPNTVAVDRRAVFTATATQSGNEDILFYWDTPGSGLPIGGSENDDQATFMWFEPGTTAVNLYAYTPNRGLVAQASKTVIVVADTTMHLTDTVWMPSDTMYIFDTVYINLPGDTVYVYLDTLYLHDTVFIHDTIEVGIDSVEADGLNITIGVTVGTITVDGAEGRSVQLYDAVGRLLASRREQGRVSFNVPSTGVYAVKVDGAPAKKVVVLRGNN